MRFFNVNKMKDMAFAGFMAADVACISYFTYNGFKNEQKKVDDFQKKYPNARIRFEPRIIAGMAGANYMVAEDKETGKIMERR